MRSDWLRYVGEAPPFPSPAGVETAVPARWGAGKAFPPIRALIMSQAAVRDPVPVAQVAVLDPGGNEVVADLGTLSAPLGSALVVDINLREGAPALLAAETTLESVEALYPWLPRVVRVSPGGFRLTGAFGAWQRRHAVDHVADSLSEPAAIRRALAGRAEPADLVVWLERSGVVVQREALAVVATCLDVCAGKTVTAVAAGMFLHPSTLARNVRRLGLPPTRELLALSRCIRALASLQADAGLGVGRAGIRFGFSSGSAFSDASVRILGIRPSAARSMFGPKELWWRYWASANGAGSARCAVAMGGWRRV